MAGFIYEQMNGTWVLHAVCWDCRQHIVVPLFHIANCDGVLICPACGAQEGLCRELCAYIAAKLHEERAR